MVPSIKAQIDAVRLGADLAAAKVELLSAECATDRIRIHYPLRDIVKFGERTTLKRAIASAASLHNFFSQLEAYIKSCESNNEVTP